MSENSLYSDILLNHLQPYVLSERELKQNYFSISPFDNISAYYKSHSYNRFKPCSRCGSVYDVKEHGAFPIKQPCIFHPGRLIYNIDGDRSYSCCNKFTCCGCKVSDYHVNSSIVCDIPIVETQVSSRNASSSASLTRAYALDTEMCYTTKGLEVTQISLVNLQKVPVFRTFVLPKNPIIDYNTPYSGVTARNLYNPWDLEEVQRLLLKFIDSGTILIGHAMHNDLHGLGIIHKRVVDTSIMFPHKLGPPRKNSLKKLASEFLQKTIQDSKDGHNSTEDATTCIELVIQKISSDIFSGKFPKNTYQLATHPVTASRTYMQSTFVLRSPQDAQNIYRC